MQKTEKEIILDEINSGKNASFCVLPFMSVTCHQNGAMTLCCEDKGLREKSLLGNIKDQSIKEHFNSDKVKEIRAKMLRGESIGACSKCYKKESKGIRSKRYYSNKRLKKLVSSIVGNTNIETGETKQKISYLNICFSNLCNLTCKMCNSFYSSGREKIEKKLKYDKKIIHSLYSGVWKIDDFHEVIPDVNEIYISGGEPFMHKELRGLVHYLHDNDFAKNILFRVNTNMTIVDHELFKLFEKFQGLRFLVSCDGYKDSYNKIRLGGSWDIFKNNFLEFLKYKNQFENMGITVNIVVQIDNISHITNLYYFFESLGINNVNLLLLTLPSHFDIRILPETFRKKRLDEIRKFVKGNFSRKEKFKDIIVALEGGMENTHLLSKYSLENETFDKYIIS